MSFLDFTAKYWNTVTWHGINIRLGHSYLKLETKKTKIMHIVVGQSGPKYFFCPSPHLLFIWCIFYHMDAECSCELLTLWYVCVCAQRKHVERHGQVIQSWSEEGPKTHFPLCGGRLADKHLKTTLIWSLSASCDSSYREDTPGHS